MGKHASAMMRAKSVIISKTLWNTNLNYMNYRITYYPFVKYIAGTPLPRNIFSYNILVDVRYFTCPLSTCLIYEINVMKQQCAVDKKWKISAIRNCCISARGAIKLHPFVTSAPMFKNVDFSFWGNLNFFRILDQCAACWREYELLKHFLA